MAAWLLVEIASTASSVSRSISVFGETEQQEGLLTSLGLAGLYAATRVATVGPASVRRSLLATLGVIAVACALAFWQLLSFAPEQWQNAPTYLEWHRAFGSLGHANLLGALAAAAFAGVIGFAASWRRGKTWWILGALLFGVTTVLTLSRAAWFGACAGSFAALILAAPWRRGVADQVKTGGRPHRATLAVAAGAVLLLFALFTLIGPLRARAIELVDLGSGSGRARLEIWKTAFAMWRAHPWLGNGPDTFRLLFDRFQTATYWQFEWGSSAFHAHSIYLHTLATRGIAGVLAAAAMLGSGVISLGAQRRKDFTSRGLVSALAGLLLALGIAGGSGALGIAGAAVVASTFGMIPSLAAQDPSARTRSANPRLLAELGSGGLAALLVLLPTIAQLRASQASFWSDQETVAWRAAEWARYAERMLPQSDLMAAKAADVLRRGASPGPNLLRDLALAEHSARRAIRLAPQRLYNYSDLALVLLAKADGGVAGADLEAVATIERCKELGPYNILPLVNFSKAALRSGRGPLALPFAQRAVTIYPREALPRAILGEVYRSMGDYAAASAATGQSLTLDWHGDTALRGRAERLLEELRHPGRITLGGR